LLAKANRALVEEAEETPRQISCIERIPCAGGIEHPIGCGGGKGVELAA
jgi:hypothetical protein